MHKSSKEHQEILDFIKRRFPENNGNWLRSNCYYFAKILTDRFPYLTIYYTSDGHFVVGYLQHYYDWTGEICITGPITNWDYIQTNDEFWADRLKRDCIL